MVLTLCGRLTGLGCVSLVWLGWAVVLLSQVCSFVVDWRRRFVFLPFSFCMRLNVVFAMGMKGG